MVGWSHFCNLILSAEVALLTTYLGIIFRQRKNCIISKWTLARLSPCCQNRTGIVSWYVHSGEGKRKWIFSPMRCIKVKAGWGEHECVHVRTFVCLHACLMLHQRLLKIWEIESKLRLREKGTFWLVLTVRYSGFLWVLATLVIFHLLLFLQNKVPPYYLGLPQTHELKWFFHLGLQRSWNWRHVQHLEFLQLFQVLDFTFTVPSVSYSDLVQYCQLEFIHENWWFSSILCT